MKKLVALLLIFIMCLSLTACGSMADGKGVVKGSNISAAGRTDRDVYVDLWGIYAEGSDCAQWLQEKADAFAAVYAAENGISVEMVYVAPTQYAAFDVSDGALPVLYQVPAQQCAALEALCADVEDYMSPEGVAAYLDGLLVDCRMEDKLFAVPGGRTAGCYIVNLDLVEQAGYTKADVENWDWDTFHEIMLAVSQLGDNMEGCGLWWGTDARMWESALYANGGSVVSEETGDILFDKDGCGARILELAAQMLEDGSLYSVYDSCTAAEVGDVLNAAFVKGALGCRMASTADYNEIRTLLAQSGKEMNLLVVSQPAGDGGFAAVVGGNNYLLLNKATETQKKVAAAYLEYIAQSENDLAWSEVSGCMAVNENTYAALSADPNAVKIGAMASYAHPRPEGVNWMQMCAYLMEELVSWSKDPAAYEAANGGSAQAAVELWANHCRNLPEGKTR